MTGYALPIGTLSFSAQQNRQAFAALYGSGASGLQAMAGVRPGPGLDVTVAGSTITATAGAAIVQSAASAIAGAYLAYLDASWTNALTAADGTFTRIDLVYLRVRDTDMDGSGFRDCTPVYLAGTPAASPVAPSIPGSTSAIVLATINVPKSGTGSPSVSYATRQYAITNGGIGVGSNTPGAYAGQYRDDGGSTGQVWRYNGTTWKSGFYLAQAGILDWGGSGGTSPISMLLAATSSDVINTRAGADTTGRYLQSADGTMAWGPGNASRDVTLNRSGVGRMTLTGALTATTMAPTVVEDTTGGRTTTSTTFVGLPVGSVMAGTVTVPPSGRVRVHLRATFRNSTSAFSWVSFSASGSVSGSQHTANTGDGLAVSGSANLSLVQERVLTGLTPGETLTVTPMHEVNVASTQTCDYRYLTLTPLL